MINPLLVDVSNKISNLKDDQQMTVTEFSYSFYYCSLGFDFKFILISGGSLILRQ